MIPNPKPKPRVSRRVIVRRVPALTGARLMSTQNKQPETAGSEPESLNGIQLPAFETYGKYSSDNYGAHALKFWVGDLIVWFSYKTPVAFRKGYGTPTIVRQNDWKQTTGKHLNAIDGGDKKSRVSGQEFERMLREAMSTENTSQNVELDH